MKDDTTGDIPTHFADETQKQLTALCGAELEWITDRIEKVTCVDCMAKAGIVREQK